MLMNNRIKNICFLAVLVLPLLVSCSEEEEETETKPSMVGSVTFDLPEYVLKNEVVTMTASGIAYPENVNYKWFSLRLTPDSLAFTTITFRMPDSLGTFSMTATAQYEGYYSAAGTRRFTTVDTARGASLSGLAAPSNVFTDPRDGMTYDYVTVGGLDWFAQNLAWDGAGVAYKNSPVTHKLFGRMYHWDEATGGTSASGLAAGPQGVCPEGWTIPTNEDWEDLATAVSGSPASFDGKWEGLGEKLSAQAFFNGEKMWAYSPDNSHTNDFGWNALPLGNTTVGHTRYNDVNQYGYWWSATAKDDGKAYFRYIFCDSGSFPMSSTSRTDFGASVRCVRPARAH